MSHDEQMIGDLPQLGADENEILLALFSEKEVFKAIAQMKNNKATTPDGFSAEFYMRCWEIIKEDLLPMPHDLFNGHLQLFHLKFGTIKLLSKKEDAVCI